MTRYRLRTLMIVLAIGPPMIAWWAWPEYCEYLKRRHINAMIRSLPSNVRIDKTDGTIEITAGVVPNLEPAYEIRAKIRKLRGYVPSKRPPPVQDPFASNVTDN